MASNVLVKEMNKDRVRDELKSLRKATIFELSQKTGVSVVTVKAVLEELIQRGEAFEGQTIPSNGGRPSMRYRYNPDYRYGIVIYGHQQNNGNLIRLLVVNLFGECLRGVETPIETIQVTSFCRYIDAVLKEYPAIGAIGFGLPGVEENGVITLTDYDGLVGDAFLNYYRNKYNVPVVFINDVNAAVKGYSTRQPSDDSSCVVGIYFPRIYPPGAGLLIHGEIYTGAHNYAGEIGRLMDVDWAELDYTNTKLVCKNIARLLSIFSCVIAPNRFILYGDFFSNAHIQAIKANTESLLERRFRVNAAFSHDFGTDVEQGMILSVIDLIERKLSSVKELHP